MIRGTEEAPDASGRRPPRCTDNGATGHRQHPPPGVGLAVLALPTLQFLRLRLHRKPGVQHVDVSTGAVEGFAGPKAERNEEARWEVEMH